MFRKSPFSNPSGNCVEANWKAHRCSTQSCVEAVSSTHCSYVHIRDSKDASGTQLALLREDWYGGRALAFEAIETRFVPAYLLASADQRGHKLDAQWYEVQGLTEDGDTASLYFDEDERDAFLAGVESDFFELVSNTEE